MALTYKGKVISQETFEQELIKDLIPKGVQLKCAISGVDFVPAQEFKNGEKSVDLIQIQYTVIDPGKYERKSVSKKYELEGKRMAAGFKGLEYLLDLLGIDFKYGIENTPELKKALMDKEVIIKFSIFIPNGGVKAYNTIEEISSVKDEEDNINLLADGRQPTDTAGFDDGIPF